MQIRQNAVEHFPTFPIPSGKGRADSELSNRLVSIRIDGADLTSDAFTTNKLKGNRVNKHVISRASVTQCNIRDDGQTFLNQKKRLGSAGAE